MERARKRQSEQEHVKLVREHAQIIANMSNDKAQLLDEIKTMKGKNSAMKKAMKMKETKRSASMSSFIRVMK